MHRRKTTEVRFGLRSLNRPTPGWARIAFGVALLITTTMAGWVAGTATLSEAAKFEWVLVLKAIDPFLFGLSKLFGVEEVR